MTAIGNGLTVLIGGARSGKSDLTIRWGKTWRGPVTFVATATAGDQDMADRINRHRQERPESWRLLEAPMLDAATLGQIDETEPTSLVIVDCITLLVANLMFDGIDDQDAASDPTRDGEIVEHVVRLGRAGATRSAPTLVVTNEVGLGVHPETRLGRRYRDLLGRANRALVDNAETALFVVAGRTIRLDEVSVPWNQSLDLEVTDG